MTRICLTNYPTSTPTRVQKVMATRRRATTKISIRRRGMAHLTTDNSESLKNLKKEVIEGTRMIKEQLKIRRRIKRLKSLKIR